MTSLEQQENGPDKAQGTDTTSAEAVGDSVATHRMEGIGSIIKTRLEDLWVDAKVKEFIPLKILNFLLFGGKIYLKLFCIFYITSSNLIRLIIMLLRAINLLYVVTAFHLLIWCTVTTVPNNGLSSAQYTSG